MYFLSSSAPAPAPGFVIVLRPPSFFQLPTISCDSVLPCTLLPVNANAGVAALFAAPHCGGVGDSRVAGLRCDEVRKRKRNSGRLRREVVEFGINPVRESGW